MARIGDFGRARIGLGGFHMGVPEDPEVGIEIVRHALDGGIRFLDNSWDYHEGESERRMGRALASGGYRDKAFLMTKVDSRSYEGVMRQFDESLQRLRTDHVDLLQMHEMIRPDDGERAAREGGFRALAELRQEGSARHIGVTGHKDADFIVAAIEAAERDGVGLDSAQVPINPADILNHSFRKIVVPACEQRGMDVLGMKPLGSARLLGSPTVEAPELLRWALSQPIAICITGCQSIADVEQALAVMREFTPMTPEERSNLELDVARLAGEQPDLEAYKKTTQHDGTANHPEWLA